MAHDAGPARRVRPRRWWHVTRRVLAQAGGDRLMVQASAVSFFALLSVAPVLVTALSVYGVINTPEGALAQLSAVTGMLPAELETVVADQLTTITTASAQVLTVRGLTGLVLALWTATTAMTYLIDGLTAAYHETETRGLLRRMGLALVLVLGGAVLLAGATAMAGVLSAALEGAPGPVLAVARIAALAVLMVGVLAVLYRVGPDRRQARWRWITGGSVFATVLWLGTTLGFFAYVQGLGDYAATYGSLAGVAISMVWLWVTVFLVLLGAAFNAEIERQTHRDSTVGPEQPPGRRGAVVADSTPPYPGER
ncbi:YihY/virulence factor BrkB family protein [Blastococcus sp. SYSU D00820]